MPIPNVTPYTGNLPDLDDPVTFDANMTTFVPFFDTAVGEIKLTVDGMNTALNDNGTVLDTAGEAIALSKNANTTTTTAGTAAAYTLAPAVAITAYADGQSFRFSSHVANTGAATMAISGLSALPIQKLVGGSLTALDASDFQANEIHQVEVVSGGTVLKLVSTPVNDIAGAVILIETKTASGNATLDFTGFDASKYGSYQFVLSNVTPATDDVDFQVLTSSDGGSTFDSSGYSFGLTGQDDSTTGPTGNGAASAAAIPLTFGTVSVGSDTNEHGVSGTVNLYGPHLAKYTNLTWHVMHDDSGTGWWMTTGMGARLSAADVDAVRFLFSSGSVESGTISMYGIRKS